MTSREIDLGEVLANMVKAKGKMLEAALDGLYDGGEHVLYVSGTMVPLDEADLERSGVVSEDRTRKAVAVSYDTPYAVAQHENTEYEHKNGREAKYLEKAMDREGKAVLKLVSDSVKRVTS